MSGITCPNAIGCLIGLVARTTKIITKSVVDALKAGETVWDRKLTGFGVRCQSDLWKKTFVFKTRIGSRQRWFTIGKYGNPWTVDSAKDQVKVIQGDIETSRVRKKCEALDVSNEMCGRNRAPAGIICRNCPPFTPADSIGESLGVFLGFKVSDSPKPGNRFRSHLWTFRAWATS